MVKFTPVDHIPEFLDEGTNVLTDNQQDTPKNPKDSWGFHLLIDMSGCDQKIDSEENIKKFFEELISNKLKMKVLSPIYFEKVNNSEEGRGVSAIQMLTTSHISMHGDDDNNRVFMDIFSCKSFEKEPVLRYIHEFLKPKSMGFREVFRDAGPLGEK